MSPPVASSDSTYWYACTCRGLRDVAAGFRRRAVPGGALAAVGGGFLAVIGARVAIGVIFFGVCFGRRARDGTGVAGQASSSDSESVSVARRAGVGGIFFGVGGMAREAGAPHSSSGGGIDDWKHWWRWRKWGQRPRRRSCESMSEIHSSFASASERPSVRSCLMSRTDIASHRRCASFSTA